MIGYLNKPEKNREGSFRDGWSTRGECREEGMKGWVYSQSPTQLEPLQARLVARWVGAHQKSRRGTLLQELGAGLHGTDFCCHRRGLNGEEGAASLVVLHTLAWSLRLGGKECREKLGKRSDLPALLGRPREGAFGAHREPNLIFGTGKPIWRKKARGTSAGGGHNGRFHE